MNPKKKWIALTAILAAFAVGFVVWRHPASNSNTGKVAVAPVPNAAPNAPLANVVSVSTNKIPNDKGMWRAPVELRTGHTEPSTDLVVALHHHPELVLTKGEIEAMLTAYLAVCDKRSAYEGEIARVVEISPNENHISIPAYAAEGVKLQDELYQKFESVVGRDRIEQVKQALASELYARNFGFGEAEQEIDVKLLEGDGIVYSFSHDVGTIHLQLNNGAGSVAYKNVDSTLSLSDLGRYSGFINLLPKGGTKS